jgi:hypothetical protein
MGGDGTALIEKEEVAGEVEIFFEAKRNTVRLYLQSAYRAILQTNVPSPLADYCGEWATSPGS